MSHVVDLNSPKDSVSKMQGLRVHYREQQFILSLDQVRAIAAGELSILDMTDPEAFARGMAAATMMLTRKI